MCQWAEGASEDRGLCASGRRTGVCGPPRAAKGCSRAQPKSSGKSPGRFRLDAGTVRLYGRGPGAVWHLTALIDAFAFQGAVGGSGCLWSVGVPFLGLRPA